jgi:hypothetical protein
MLQPSFGDFLTFPVLTHVPLYFDSNNMFEQVYSLLRPPIIMVCKRKYVLRRQP